jgi:hypothetical protein
LKKKTRRNPGSSIPDIILQQLGGFRFIAMTGAKHFQQARVNALQFTIPANQSGANRVLIELDHGTDTYNVTFFKLSRKKYVIIPVIKIVSSINGAYADQLREIFTRVTGLDTHL